MALSWARNQQTTKGTEPQGRGGLSESGRVRLTYE